jgi:hypothetical protein
MTEGWVFDSCNNMTGEWVISRKKKKSRHGQCRAAFSNDG